jgi:hypothetical protein
VSTFKIEGSITVEREQGKFVSRDDLAEAIQQALDDLEPELSGLGADGNSDYFVADSSISVT